jgi:hypothetical protein
VNVCSLFPFTVCGIDDDGPLSQRATGFQNVNCCTWLPQNMQLTSRIREFIFPPFTVCGIDDEGPVSQRIIWFQNVNYCVLVASEHAADRQNKRVHLRPYLFVLLLLSF